MNREQLLEGVRRVIVDQLNVEENDVTEDACIVDDLGADELDIVELLMDIEEEFGISIPDEQAEELGFLPLSDTPHPPGDCTVGRLVDYLVKVV